MGPGDRRNYLVDEVLRDGASVRIRAIRSDDKQRFLDAFGKLSTRSIQFRFFGAKRSLTDEELRRFTAPDFVGHVALVATLLDTDTERIIGAGRYIQADNAAPAEIAFTVADEFQGRGIGTRLLDHLGRIARASGIAEFEADVLSDNNPMLKVFAKSGWTVSRSMESGIVHLKLSTAEPEGGDSC